jgi:phosphoglycolate phosphatase
VGEFLRVAKKLVIFDMDGTLIDTGTAISNAVNFVRKYHNLEPIQKNILLDAMNNPDIHSPSFFYNTPEFTTKQIELFHEYYDKYSTYQLELYGGILELLEKLKVQNILMCVATNANSKNAKELLTHTGILSFFTHIVGADMVENPKPSADMVTYLLENTGINKDNSILIGDSLKDLYAAKNAGIDSILVEWGFTKHDTKAISDIKILEKKILERFKK